MSADSAREFQKVVFQIILGQPSRCTPEMQCICTAVNELSGDLCLACTQEYNYRLALFRWEALRAAAKKAARNACLAPVQADKDSSIVEKEALLAACQLVQVCSTIPAEGRVDLSPEENALINLAQELDIPFVHMVLL